MKHGFIYGCIAATFVVAAAGALSADHDGDNDKKATATPIKHLVVIFQENVSFDHYFGTYPIALNLPGETPFRASKKTPTSINNLVTPLDVNNQFKPLVGIDLLNNNPNNNPAAPGNGRTNGANF